MKPERAYLLSIVQVEIHSATDHLDRAVLQRRWRDYCHQLEECISKAKEEDIPKIVETHFRVCPTFGGVCVGSYPDAIDGPPLTIRRQGEFASNHWWDKPTEDQRVADVALAVRNGDVPYNKLLAALGVKICVGPAGRGACELPLGHEGPHRLSCLELERDAYGNTRP